MLVFYSTVNFDTDGMNDRYLEYWGLPTVFEQFSFRHINSNPRRENKIWLNRCEHIFYTTYHLRIFKKLCEQKEQ